MKTTNIALNQTDQEVIEEITLNRDVITHIAENPASEKILQEEINEYLSYKYDIDHCVEVCFNTVELKNPCNNKYRIDIKYGPENIIIIVSNNYINFNIQ